MIYEFKNPARFGYGIEWPIDYNEIAPLVFACGNFYRDSGNRDGLEAMPDGEFQAPFDLNKPEPIFKESI